MQLVKTVVWLVGWSVGQSGAWLVSYFLVQLVGFLGGQLVIVMKHFFNGVKGRHSHVIFVIIT